jgi:hypothetical protein
MFYYKRIFAIWVLGIPKILSANSILLYILGVFLGLAERLSRNIAGITDSVLDKRESILLIKPNLDPWIIFLGRTILQGLLLLLLLSLSAVLSFAFCVSGYIAFFFQRDNWSPAFRWGGCSHWSWLRGRSVPLELGRHFYLYPLRVSNIRELYFGERNYFLVFYKGFSRVMFISR